MFWRSTLPSGRIRGCLNTSVSTTENLSPTAHRNNHPKGVCSTLCLAHKEKTALATAKRVGAATFFFGDISGSGGVSFLPGKLQLLPFHTNNV